MLIEDILSSVVPHYIQPAQGIAYFYTAYSRFILDQIHLLLKGTFNVLLGLTIIVSLFYMCVMFYSMFLKRKHSYAAVKQDELPLVTVQIPTYNEIAAVNCARRCLDFEYPIDRYQVIIGDDSNKQEISARIDGFAERHPGRILVTRRGSNIGFKPGNLNHMLKYSKGELIVIFDSDFLPERDFLKKIVAPFVGDKRLAAAQARWRISNFTQNMTTILGGSVSIVMHHFAMPFMVQKLDTSFLCGSAEAVRKDALVAVGGWKEGSLTEDIECSLRLVKKGYKLTYLEDLECDCETPFTVKDFCKQQMRWAYGVISSFIEHFKGIFFSSGVSANNKVGGAIMLSGYSFSFLLMMLFVFGTLSFLTDRPAPINWGLFLSETGRNVLLTCGILLVTIVGLTKRNYVKYLAHLLVATFSVGLVVTAYVNIGILKAIFGRPMQWFMLSKIGNTQVDPR